MTTAYEIIVGAIPRGCPFFRTWIVILGLAAFIAPLGAFGDDGEITINATLDEDFETLVGSAQLKIKNNTGAELSKIPIRLYPNRFDKIDPNLDDRMIRWIYPSGESLGSMEIRAPVWNGVPIKGSIETSDTIAWVRLPRPLGPDETGELSLDFHVQIPERRGRFGRWRGVVSLAGGWFPRPLTDLTGRDTTLPPNTIEVDVVLSLPEGLGAVLDDQIFRRVKKKQTISARGLKVDSLVLTVMDMMDVDEHVYDWGKVVHVHQEVRNHEATWQDTRGGDGGYPPGLKDLGEVDISGRIFEVVGNTARLIQDRAPNLDLKKRLVLVDVPAWDMLVQTGPGPILVSDRIWRVFPAEVVLWFHDLALSRVVAAELLRSLLKDREPLAHRLLTGDIVGSFVAKQYLEEIHGEGRTVKDIIGAASFIPAIDNMIYAPQVPFRAVYFRSVEEPDQFRDEPWRFMNDTPRGKRIFGKLEDLIGQDGAKEFMVDYLGSEILFKEALENKLGDEAKAFLGQWYGRYPEVNYRIGKIEDIEKTGSVFLHRIEVIRDGDTIKEPVTVRITDEDKVSKDLVWDGDGKAGVVEWISKAPVDSVRIDPGGRLVESPELTDDHPLADNADRLPWRPPMITRILVSGDFATGDPYIQAGFIMRRRYDLSNAFVVNGSYTPRSYGGSLGYLNFFGPKRTLNARTWYFGPYLGATRYNEVEDVGTYLPDNTLFGATAASIKLLIGRNNRVYFFDPRSGSGFSARVGYSLGGDDDGRTVQTGQLGTNYVAVASPSIRHTFALHIGAMGVFGRPAAAQLVTLSLREILKGFDIDETYGRLGLYVVGEHRFTIVDAAHIKAPVFSWFDRFQGVLSVGGGTISDPSGYSGLFTADRLYSEVGCGLRIHLLALGVQQYIIALDFAYPITPFNRQYEIEQNDITSYMNRDPFKIKFGIMQTF